MTVAEAAPSDMPVQEHHVGRGTNDLPYARQRDAMALGPPQPGAGPGGQHYVMWKLTELLGKLDGQDQEGPALRRALSRQRSRQQVENVANYAVTLEFLLRFADLVPPEKTTVDVVEELIRVATASRKCRFADVMPVMHVGDPDYFISHKARNIRKGCGPVHVPCHYP